MASGGLARDEGSVGLQGQSLGRIDACIGEGKKDEHNGKDSLKMRTGQFGFHIFGDEMAEIHDHLGRFAQHGEAGVEFSGAQAEGVAQLADRFESTQGIPSCRREKAQRADQIRSAEEVSDL